MSKRKSCMNIEPARPGCFFHISREVVPNYLIDSTNRNSYDKSAIEAQAYYTKLLAEATYNYMKRTKQRLQVLEEKLLWEAVVVLEEYHTLEDIKKLAHFFEKKYGWQVVQTGLHADEGYEDEVAGKIIYNYHAHIVFLMLNKLGIYVFKKRDYGKKAMSKLQTDVARILKMPRGKDKRSSGRERLSAKQYRQVSQEKYDLQFKLDRMKEDASLFEEAMLDQQQLRMQSEVEIKQLQQKILKMQEAREGQKNIVSNLQNINESNEEFLIDETTVIKPRL